ncbi:MAG: MBOAT family protein [Alphaproteobacteria bacterium]|nr:MBOAT family protein [Alphaproteobacteria bacterium]
MLFNSFEFLFLFLPATLGVYYVLRRWVAHHAALVALTIASFVFYAWWDVRYLPLLLGSIIINHLFGLAIARWRPQPWLAIGVVLNLASIGLFKYADFFLSNINAVAGSNLPLPGFALPLAISFFTFQQISFLVDVARRETRPSGWLGHGLFVSFFPQLIAGPIVRHDQIAPQYEDTDRKDDWAENIGVGLSIFAIGISKKVLLADNFEPFAASAFGAAARGDEVGLLEAWTGALCYTFQIFFDFSGYSDMAIGLARMFGYKLPINFNAPYRARSIIDFWRRWHITLSQFLRDYLYIPLGGNRNGQARRAINLAVVMLLGGLWHGAAWTFVFWGALHGLALGWCNWLNKVRPNGLLPSAPWVSVAFTFLFVVIAWVFFRATSFDAALLMLQGMAGLHGIGPGVGDEPFIAIAIGLAIVWGLPDTASVFMKWFDDATLKTAGLVPQKGLRFTTRPWISGTLAFLLFLSIVNAWNTAEFIYYNF